MAQGGSLTNCHSLEICFEDGASSLYVGLREGSRITKGLGMCNWKDGVSGFEMGEGCGRRGEQVLNWGSVGPSPPPPKLLGKCV